MHPRAGGFLGGDGEALSPPQHGGGGVGRHVAAEVHRVPLPRVEDGVVGQELGDICAAHKHTETSPSANLVSALVVPAEISKIKGRKQKARRFYARSQESIKGIDARLAVRAKDAVSQSPPPRSSAT